MSEAELRDAFGDDLGDDLPDDSQEQEQNQQDEQPKGYMSKDAWVAAGKDPEDWVSPEVFKERGIRIEETSKLRKQLSQAQQDMESRIANLNKLHRAQLEQERNKLLVERDNAIDIADKAEVRRIDKALEQNAELSRDVAESVPAQKPVEVAEWESENEWIYDPQDPRTAPAIAAFTEAQRAGKTMASCIVAADRAAAKALSGTPQTKRSPMPASDVPRSRQSSSGKIQLTMQDVTRDERELRSFFSSDAEFLKAVADNRE